MPYAQDSRRRRVYVGEWIEAFGLEQKAVAKAARITPAYLNGIIKGSKPLASLATARAIADAIGIKVDDLYHPPPDKAAVVSLGQLSDAARALLMATERDKERTD